MKVHKRQCPETGVKMESNTDALTIMPLNAKDIPAQDGIFTSLAELPAQAILTEAAMAKAFGVTGRTIRRMVARYELPPPVTISGRSTWFAGRVLTWIESKAERQEREAGKMLAKIAALSG